MIGNKRAKNPIFTYFCALVNFADSSQFEADVEQIAGLENKKKIS